MREYSNHQQVKNLRLSNDRLRGELDSLKSLVDKRNTTIIDQAEVIELLKASILDIKHIVGACPTIQAP